MGVYDRLVFPWLCDLALSAPSVRQRRRALLAGACGMVLELGFGTGLNLPHYPPHIQEITAIDPNAAMQRRARRRIRQTSIKVDVRLGRGEHLPFPDATFDTVVSTFTLCSVDDPRRVLAEAHRVLAPGGRLLLLEHGLSPHAGVQKWQRRLNSLQRRLGGNCHLTRPIGELVREQPFNRVELSESYLEQAPKTHGYLYQGFATK